MWDTLILEAIEFFSNPTRKDTFEITDNLEHLTWYRAHGRATWLDVEYTNQFETDTVRIDSVKYLLLPTAKEVPDPFPEELDHYKAYRIQDPVAFDRTVELEDQFDILYGAPEFIETLKPIYFLTPALKNMPPPMYDSVTHYVAYEIFPQRYFPLSVLTFDQFGEHDLQVDTSKILLVPTDKLGVTQPCSAPNIGCPVDESQHMNGNHTTTTQWTADDGNPGNPAINITSVTVCGSLPPGITSAVVNVDPPGLPAKTATGTVTYTVGDHSQSGGPICLQVANNCTPPLTDQCTFNVSLTNNPPVIFQPDTLYGYQVCDTVIYEFAGADPDSDVILDGASLSIEPPCGTYSVTRISNPGGSSGRWQVTWDTHGCVDSTTYMIIVDLTDTYGETSYCTTYCHLDPNTPPTIDQPDFLEGNVDDIVIYTITATDPDGDVLADDASIYIDPGCGTYFITRLTGHGTSSGDWEIRWFTTGCTPCDTHRVTHDVTDGCDTAYCTTYVHLSEVPGWYWKPSYEDYAPNGMVDIDQKQDDWIKAEGPAPPQYTFCGPCAVANCFKWFDSKYNVPPGFPGDLQDQFPLVRQYIDGVGGMISPWDDHDPWNIDHPATPWMFGATPPPPPTVPQPFVAGPQPPGMPPWGELVERLAWYFNTDGVQTGYCDHAGTNVMEMQTGIQEWLESERFPGSEQQFVRGDVNEDGTVDLVDVAACAAGGPFSCDDAADVNDDGVLDANDCSYLSAYLTATGPRPPSPFPNCGIDPTPDALGCADFPCPFSNTLADTLCEVTTPMPTFAQVESLVEKCEDVILLLGFWFEDPPGSGEWWRIGGHYVTVAGVNSDLFQIAFSDPFVDAAETGFPGRVRDGVIIGHPHGTHDPTLHNDEGNVSHDIYQVDTSPVSPGGVWWLPEYMATFDPDYFSENFFGQNVPDEFFPQTAPWNGTSPIYTEVEYCVHISPWDYRGDANADGIVNIGDVVYLVSFLYKGGPAPVPMSEGDVNCDGIVDVGDVVFLVNYLYRKGPVPRCCDP
jgi:hypothetical protein